MKNKKIFIVLGLIIFAMVLLVTIFTFAIIKSNNTYFATDKDFKDAIVGKEIVNPDRIVYRNSDGEYFEFKNGSKSYDQIKALLSNIIKDYDKNGEFLTEEQIDEIHSKSFIEFDYKTASKNYIIQLEENKDQAVIKLADSGGSVVTKKILNRNKLKNTVDTLSKSEKKYTLDYKELTSLNHLEYLEYKYQELFKNDSGVYQVKIENMSDYEKFKEICNIAVDTIIDKNTFVDNEIILTVTYKSKIDVKVSVGNIKYTYDKVENAEYACRVHLLIVSRIVNTDCIYNKNISQVESQVEYDNFKVNYNNSVENLNKDIFVTDFETFLGEYDNFKNTITEEEAKKVAETGFMEAERICGAYDDTTETVSEETVVPNNFFTRKISEGDMTYQRKIDVYVFSRVDSMGNGVSIYVDKKSGKIVGGVAFGD